MKITVVFSLWIAVLLVSDCECFEMNEPHCLSRFDYDYKVLQKLVSLENSQTVLQETIKKQENLIYVLKESMKENIENLLDDKLISLETTQTELQQTIKQHKNLTSEWEKSMKENNENVQDEIQKLMPSRPSDSLGSTYTRWGRTSCPGNGTQMVYEGYAAGSYYSHSGGAANYLCLPKEPKWGHFEDSLQTSAEIYGVEYQLNDRNRPTFFGRELQEHDAPCAVCMSSRSNMLMIPGRNVCYDGWTLEYTGYLVAGYRGHKGASEFVCLDIQPEVIEGGDGDKHGKLFFFAEARCGGSLKCPPYVNGRELTCVVCTK